MPDEKSTKEISTSNNKLQKKGALGLVILHVLLPPPPLSLFFSLSLSLYPRPCHHLFLHLCLVKSSLVDVLFIVIKCAINAKRIALNGFVLPLSVPLTHTLSLPLSPLLALACLLLLVHLVVLL